MRIIDDIEALDNLGEILDYIQNVRVSFMAKPKSWNYYANDFCTLDIETTNESDLVGYPYIFQMTIFNQCVYVRTYEDFACILNKLIASFHLGERRRLIIYVYNLSYEMFYLWQLLNRDFHMKEDLCPKSLKPLIVRYSEGLEFRDALKLFQKSLANATKNVKHSKRVGDLDYKIIRYPDTHLTDDELRYCLYDVVGMREAILELMTQHNYDMARIPLTNTGIVRSSVLNAVRSDPVFTAIQQDVVPDRNQMILLVKSMAGGDTHGNARLRNKIIENCNMADITSAHPSQMLLQKYPCGKLETYPYGMTLEDYSSLVSDFAIWMVVKFEDITLKNNVTNPVISLSKAVDISSNAYCTENGRITYAEKLELPCDSNDFSRILRSYNWRKCKIIFAVISKLKYLPESFRNVVKQWFENKSSISDKGDFLYMFSKICINTIFGACAQKPIRDSYTAIVNGNEIMNKTIGWIENLENTSDEEYQKIVSRKTALPFVWGTWTASLTRLQLFNMQEKIGWNRVIYWDTDSIYYIGKKAKCIEEFNKEKIEQVIERNALVYNYENKPVYIGAFTDDYEGEEYGLKRFKFLHAKCYWKETEKYSEFTIAGVAKKNAMEYIKTPENFVPGFYISDAGGKKLKYCSRPIRKITRGSVTFTVASHIVMSRRDYKLNNATDIEKITIEDLEPIA